MKRRHSIWMKIVALPLIWVFLAILLLSFASVYVGYTRTLDQKRLAGLAVAQQFRNRLAERSRAITALEEVLERTALNAAQVAAAEYAEVSDELLTETAQKLGVSVLNWYDPSGTVDLLRLPASPGAHCSRGVICPAARSLWSGPCAWMRRAGIITFMPFSEHGEVLLFRRGLWPTSSEPSRRNWALGSWWWMPPVGPP